MNFEDDDLDWAMGEMLHMIKLADRFDIPPHEYNPELFFQCMHIIGRQPFEVKARVWPTLQLAHPNFVKLILYANPVPH